jgi:hypothetical protein
VFVERSGLLSDKCEEMPIFDWIVRDASLVLAIAAELRLVPSATPD